MTRVDTTTTKKASQRRSQRLLLRVMVSAQRKKQGKETDPEQTETLAVNAHGAMILLNPPVDENELLSLKNDRTGETQDCRVVFLGSMEAGRLQVGVEFTSPSPGFWRISFPPEDWSSSGKDLRSPAPRS